MARTRPVVTEMDRERLQRLIDAGGSRHDKARLIELQEELDSADTVPTGSVQSDVVRIGSRVGVRDVDTGAPIAFTIVLPGDADATAHRISVLAPVGTALLGYAVGDVVEWSVPGGRRHLRIETVQSQPGTVAAAADGSRRVA